MKQFFGKRPETCQVHGAPAKAANKTLLVMMLAFFSLIIWHVWVYGPSSQTATATSLPQPFPAQLGSELWDLAFSGHGILAELRDVFPYFVVGVLLAGYLRTYKIAVKLQAALRRYGVASVFLASLVGAITPLCACGTLTTAVSLLFAGLPLAPVMSLMVTSPLLSPTTYLLTLNDLGPEWTVYRTVAALAMGIFAGLVTHLLRKRGFETNSLFIEGAIVRGDFHDEDYPDERLRCNCKERFGNRIAVRTGNTFLVFLAKSAEMSWLVGKYILVGVAIGTVVQRYMPYEWVYQLFERKDPLSIVWVTLGSVPIFLHQISASSILYHIKSSLHGTLDAGAGLAFMIGGPVTAMPTMILFWTIFKKRVFALYLSICLVGTMMIAYAFQFLVFVPGVDTGNHLLKGVSSLSGGGSSVIQKQNQFVRIVLDPEGKSIVATAKNDLAGQGGIVFDAGGERFLAASATNFDNIRYVTNIAEWLREENSSPSGSNILIYATSGAGVLCRESLPDALKANLEDQGFTVRITDRRETPVLSGSVLGNYGQLWMLFGGSGDQEQLADAELEEIARFTDAGNGMLIVAGSQVEAGVMQPVNRLSGRYGVTFSGKVENRAEIPTSIASSFFHRSSAVLGRILKLVHKA